MWLLPPLAGCGGPPSSPPKRYAFMLTYLYIATGGAIGSVLRALTANAFAEDKDACLSAGMDDVLTKPASKASLYVALLRLVEARRESPLRASA